jgi:Na+-translocating ferredoxin:NAD+ oxidoreductase subunit B
VLIIYAIAALGLIGLIFGLLLAMAARFFAVQTDPLVESIKEVLPGANCGACGYAGCSNFAEAVAGGETKTNGCIPGGEETAKAVAELLGQEASASAQPLATVFCIGDCYMASDRFVYDGVADCAVASDFVGGFKSCSYGCLGLGNCVRACLFDAIKMGEHGLPVVDYDKCTGCGLCATACPRSIIQMLPKGKEGHLVLCNSHDRGKSVSAACDVGCIACKACVKACPQDAIEMVDNLAVIDLEKCNDCGECVPKCKPGTIHRRAAIPSEADALASASAKVAESA